MRKTNGINRTLDTSRKARIKKIKLLRRELRAETANLTNKQKIGRLNNFYANLPGGYRYKNQKHGTDKKFYADVNKAITRRGIRVGKILELQEYCMDNFDRPGFETDPRTSEYLNHVLLPIYSELRAMGYKHSQLWS